MLRALDAYIRELVARHLEIEEVVLFGSLVTGIPVPGSDVDLIVIMTSSDQPFLSRIPQFLPGEFPIGVDVFPYTREEMETMKRDGNTFVLGALRNGRVVFRRHRA